MYTVKFNSDMSLFISLLLMLGVSNSSNIADSLYLDVEKAVSDTLYCSISNQFLEFSLGYYHSLDSLSNHLNWHNNYEPIVLNHFNKKDLAEIFFIFKNKRNLVTFRKNFSDGDGAYFVRFALIQDPNITLKTNAIKNEIQIGMKKAELFKTVGIDVSIRLRTTCIFDSKLKATCSSWPKLGQVDSTWVVLPTCLAGVHGGLHGYSRSRVSGVGHPPSIHVD